MESHKKDLMQTPSLEDIIAVDLWARKRVDELAAKIGYTVQA